jgi:hypothetical protein
MTHSPSFNGLKGLAQFSWNGIDGVLQLAIVLQKQIYELPRSKLKSAMCVQLNIIGVRL